MRVAIGSDHAGFTLKEILRERLTEDGYTVLDLGTYSTEAVDYPDFIGAVAVAVLKGHADRGIVLGGSGEGECIAANKFPGIRAALCEETYTAHMTMEHNNANVLSLGARVIGEDLAWEVVKTWLSSEFTGEERHARRIGKIAAWEEARRFPIQELQRQGQSLWYDYILRSELRSGAFRDLVRKGITGVTSNPTIFEKAIGGSNDYAEDIERLSAEGRSTEEIREALTIADIREAADQLRPIYDLTQRADGYVSLELPPNLANDTHGSMEAAHRLWPLVDRPNIMLKVPGTPEGVPVVEALIADGMNVNITLLFSIEQYEAVALAYMSGLERRLSAGHPIDDIASVASFFVSRIDTAVDAILGDQHAALHGKAAIANAKLAYQLFEALFGDTRWEALADHGAQLQRLLWASTSTKNPAYRDVLYVEELIGRHTVNTVPPVALNAFLDHGFVQPTLQSDVDAASHIFDELRAAGIDLTAVTNRLQVDGVKAFIESWDNLLAAVERQRTVIAASRL